MCFVLAIPGNARCHHSHVLGSDPGLVPGSWFLVPGAVTEVWGIDFIIVFPATVGYPDYIRST